MTTATMTDAQLVQSLFRCSHERARRKLADNECSLRKLIDSSPFGSVIKEASGRYLSETMHRGDSLNDVTAVRNYLCHQLRGYPHEVFAVLFLDNKHRVIEYEEMFRGTVDSASVHPREVVKAAMKHNACAVIFAHNHPSGNTEPSQADHRITDRLKDALSLVDVRVLDHFIIGDEVLSFAEKGYL